MRHLTDEDYIAYLSVSEMEPQSMALIERVNTHIRECEYCLSRMQAFALISRELDGIKERTEETLIMAEMNRQRERVVVGGAGAERAVVK